MTFSGMPSTPLIIATRNQHKSAEIRQMVGDAFEVKDATDFPDWPEVAETGTTFLENATLKAVVISALVEGYVLSDDSGLEVDALNGGKSYIRHVESSAILFRLILFFRLLLIGVF